MPLGHTLYVRPIIPKSYIKLYSKNVLKLNGYPDFRPITTEKPRKKE